MTKGKKNLGISVSSGARGLKTGVQVLVGTEFFLFTTVASLAVDSCLVRIKGSFRSDNIVWELSSPLIFKQF